MGNLKKISTLVFGIALMSIMSTPVWAADCETTGVHVPGIELWEADYTECGGGYKEDVYRCSECGIDVYADGREAEWTEQENIR